MSLSFVSVLLHCENASSSGFSRTNPGGGVLDDDAVLRGKTKQGSSFQVRFGIRFADGDIACGDKLRRRSDPGHAQPDVREWLCA